MELLLPQNLVQVSTQLRGATEQLEESNRKWAELRRINSSSGDNSNSLKAQLENQAEVHQCEMRTQREGLLREQARLLKQGFSHQVPSRFP